MAMKLLRNILFPFVPFYFAATWIRNLLYNQGIKQSRSYDLPIICVGNIYIGGTGKTPTSIYLAKELSKSGKNPTIFRKYYKSHFDEHLLIKKNFSNLILNNDRVKGVLEAKAKNYDTIIFDDGFQDYKIDKDLNIVCFNQNQLIGNGFVLPAGPLRENINSLKNANLVLINGIKNSNFEKKILEINKNLIFLDYLLTII